MQYLIHLDHCFQIVVRWLDFPRKVTPSNGPVGALRWRRQCGSYKPLHPGPKPQGVHGDFPSSLLFDGVPCVPSKCSTRMERCMSHSTVLSTSSSSALSRPRFDDPRVDLSRRRLRLRPSHGSFATNNCTHPGRLTFVFTRDPGPSVSRSRPICFGFEILLSGSTRCI